MMVLKLNEGCYFLLQNLNRNLLISYSSNLEVLIEDLD